MLMNQSLRRSRLRTFWIGVAAPFHALFWKHVFEDYGNVVASMDEKWRAKNISGWRQTLMLGKNLVKDISSLPSDSLAYLILNGAKVRSNGAWRTRLSVFLLLSPLTVKIAREECRAWARKRSWKDLVQVAQRLSAFNRANPAEEADFALRKLRATPISDRPTPSLGAVNALSEAEFYSLSHRSNPKSDPKY